MVEAQRETYQEWLRRIGALGIPELHLRIECYRAGNALRWAKATNRVTGEIVSEWSIDRPSPKEPGE